MTDRSTFSILAGTSCEDALGSFFNTPEVPGFWSAGGSMVDILAFTLGREMVISAAEVEDVKKKKRPAQSERMSHARLSCSSRNGLVNSHTS